MAMDIKSLLKKKKWTGAEVGIALLANFANDIKMTGMEYKPIFTEKNLRRMEGTLKSPEDQATYTIYKTIFRSVVETYNRGIALRHMFYNGSTRLLQYIKYAVEANNIERNIEDFPVIMTQAQYDRFIKEIKPSDRERKERILNSGIAILQHPLSHQVDKDGDYIETDILRGLVCLEHMAQDEKERQLLIEELPQLVIQGLSYLYAYNALVDILTRIYKLEDAEMLKHKTADMEEQITLTNDMIEVFYMSVYGTASEKKRKQAIIRELFHPINTGELKPTPATIKQIEDRIDSQGISQEARKELKCFDHLIDELMLGGWQQ